MQGDLSFNNFYAANSWSKSFLPNHFLRVSTTGRGKFSFIKAVTEKMLDNRLGNWLDDYLMKVTAKRWNKKMVENKKNMKGITMSMIAKKHLAKPNPLFFQNILLKRYSDRIEQLVKQHESDYA